MESGPTVETRRSLLQDPAASWNCGAGCFDVKRWFVGIITPDFGSDEARVTCGSLRRIDQGAAPVYDNQEQKMRTMRSTNSDMNNPKDAAKDQAHLAERCFGPVKPGSIRSAASALAASALGAGALAMPYAFAQVGVVLGLVTLAAVGLISALSLQILMVAARYTDTSSYAAILELSSGSAFAATLLDCGVLLNGIGSVICILIFEGDFLPPAVFAGLGLSLSRTWAILGTAVLVWPLTLTSNISALRYVTIAVPFGLMLTIAIVMRDVPHFAAERPGRVHLWKFEPFTWLQSVAIMINAFANHMNAVPVANALDHPSIARIVKSTVNGNMVVFTLLAGLGLSGYLSWGEDTKGDFLLNYPDGRADITCCRLLLGAIVFCVLPVALFPTSKSGAQLLETAFGLAEGKSWTQPLTATLLLATCARIAVLVEDVASVVGILGGILAASLMFWFPCVVYRRLLWHTQPEPFRKPVVFCLVLLGSLAWLSVLLKYI